MVKLYTFSRVILFWSLLLVYSGKSVFGQADSSKPRVGMQERIADLESKYNIRIYTDTFTIDTSRAEIAPPKKAKDTAVDIGKDSLKNVIMRGHSKYAFNYLQGKDKLQRDSLLEIFFEEWEKYPVEFVRASGLKAIAFVKNLKVMGQTRFAMPEGRSNTLYFNVNFQKARNDLYLRHCMHHEFYHLIEKDLFSSFYYEDQTWLSFNPAGFSYGDGGAAGYATPEFSKRLYPFKGFVTGYASSGIEEDKAEMFGYLMTTPEFLKLVRWAREDQALACKMAYMMGFLRGICREMDYDYFLCIHKVNMKTVIVPVFPNNIP